MELYDWSINSIHIQLITYINNVEHILYASAIIITLYFYGTLFLFPTMILIVDPLIYFETYKWLKLTRNIES